MKILKLRFGLCVFAAACFVAARPCQIFASDYFDIQHARLAFEIDPIGALISFNAEDFAVQGHERQEVVSGNGSYFPSLRLGLGLDAPCAAFEITAGGGVILNNAFTAPVFSANLLACFALADNITLGPRVGALYSPSPDWKGKESDITLDGAAGFRGGLVLTFKRLLEKWSLVFSADYLVLQYDAKESSEWRLVGENKLDVSGLALQAGLIYRPKEYARVPRMPSVTPTPSPSTIPSLPVAPTKQPLTLEPLHSHPPTGDHPKIEPIPVPEAAPKPAPVAESKPLPKLTPSEAIAPNQPDASEPAPAQDETPAETAQPVNVDDPGPDDGADLAP